MASLLCMIMKALFSQYLIKKLKHLCYQLVCYVVGAVARCQGCDLRKMPPRPPGLRPARDPGLNPGGAGGGFRGLADLWHGRLLNIAESRGSPYFSHQLDYLKYVITRKRKTVKWIFFLSTISVVVICLASLGRQRHARGPSFRRRAAGRTGPSQAPAVLFADK